MRFHDLLSEIGESVIVMLSTHIVSDVSDLCSRMAIMHQGELRLVQQPAEAVAGLRGRLWERTVEKAEVAKVSESLALVSTRLVAGRTRVRVLADATPGAGLRAGRARAGGRLLRRPARGGPAVAGGLTMLLAIAGFEVRQRLHRVSTYVYFAVFLVLAAFFILAAGGAIPNATVDFGTGGKVDINSPWSLAMLMTLIASFTVVINAAIAGRATHQDVDANVTPLLFTRPITRAQYLGGRFLGALGVLVLLSLAIGLGAFVATKLPWMPAARVGPQRFAAYAVPYLLVVLPDLVLMASVFFALAVLTRRMLPVYVGAVVALLGYFIGVNLTGDVERRTVAALVDPFGLMAIDSVTHYWSIAEKNTRLLGLQGDFLWNRLLWTTLAVAIFGFTYRRFSFSAPAAPAARAAPEGPPRTAPGWQSPAPGWTSPPAPPVACSPDWSGSSCARRSRASSSGSSSWRGCCSSPPPHRPSASFTGPPPIR